MRPRLSSFVLGAVALGLVYVRLLRTPILTWGATDEEASARLPGDELPEEADGVATRAIEIHAAASGIWPWIAQMGPSPRGGAYMYDWIDAARNQAARGGVAIQDATEGAVGPPPTFARGVRATLPALCL